MKGFIFILFFCGSLLANLNCITECYYLGIEMYDGKCWDVAACAENTISEDGSQCALIRKYYEVEEVECENNNS